MTHNKPTLDSLKKVKQIFLEAQNIPPEKRQEFVRSACRQQPDCIHQTTTLLGMHFNSGSILDLTLEQLIAEVESEMSRGTDDDDETKLNET